MNCWLDIDKTLLNSVYLFWYESVIESPSRSNVNKTDSQTVLYTYLVAWPLGIPASLKNFSHFVTENTNLLGN